MTPWVRLLKYQDDIRLVQGGVGRRILKKVTS